MQMRRRILTELIDGKSFALRQRRILNQLKITANTMIQLDQDVDYWKKKLGEYEKMESA